MSSFDEQVAETQNWLESPRFRGITRLDSARQVAQQRGKIDNAYTRQIWRAEARPASWC
jgi:isocitrate lyase